MDRIRACLYLSVFVIMGLSDAVIPILPELSNNVAMDQSMLFSAYFAGALVTMIPFGILADRYGHPPFIALSIALTVAAGLLIICFDTFSILACARFMEGCACGAFFPAAVSILAEFENQRQYIGEFNFLLNLGLAMGVAIAAALKCHYLKAGILVFAALALPALALSISLARSRSRPPLHSHTHALAIPPATPTTPHTRIGQEIARILPIVFDARYLRIWVTSFVLFGGTGVLVAYFPSFANSMQLTPFIQGLALSGVYLGTMVTSLIGGRARIEEGRMIRMGALITGAGIMITVYHPFGLTIMGAGSGFALVGLVSGVASLGSNRGMAMGVFNTFTYAGFALLPVFAAALLESLDLDYTTIFWVTGVAVGALAVFSLRFSSAESR
ncbi:MAG: MFS transporter [Methanosarcinales archaeon]|nr:MFS transporter [Methanosarcinales archaeon]